MDFDRCRGRALRPAFGNWNLVVCAKPCRRAFALHGKDNSGIYTTTVGGEKALRLTSNSGDCCPRWSPDGRHVAFSRSAREGVDIYVIPPLGGNEHRLLPSPPEEQRIAKVPGWRFSGRCLDWSPNGKVV